MKKMLLLIFIMFFVLPGKVFALESSPSMKLNSSYVPESGILEVDFESEVSFVVRPVSDTNNVQIWNPQSLSWVHSQGNWTDMPKTSKNMQIRFSDPLVSKKEFGFVLQNTLTSVQLHTKNFVIWNRKYAQDYIRSLNSTALKNNKIFSARLVWEW